MRYLYFLLFLPTFVYATGEPYPIGARSWAMGNSLVAVADRHSIFNNPAGLGFLQNSFVNTSYHSRFGVSGLQTISISGNYNLKPVNIGFGIDRFGDKLYNEQRLGLALGKGIGRFSLGVKVNYLQAVIENLTSRKTFLTEFGVISKISSKLHAGFHVSNLTGGKLFETQVIPTIIRLGMGFLPSKQILITVEAERNLNLPTIVKAGLEYQIIQNVYLRTGIMSKINNAHFGIGFAKKNLIFDYAANTHQSLGFSHHISLSYQLTNKEVKP